MSHCPHAAGAVGYAVAACPFLSRYAATAGPETAARVAVDPRRPSTCPARGPVLLEPACLDSLTASFELMHGDGGALPLGATRVAAARAAMAPPTPTLPPAARAPATSDGDQVKAGAPVRGGRGPSLPPRAATAATAAPFAALSFSFFSGLPDPAHWLRRARRPKRRPRRQQPPSSNGRSGGGGVRVATRAPPPPPPPPRPARRDGKAQPPPASSSSSHALGDGGCPLRGWPVVGALIPLSAGGDVACPPAIVALRAAVARVPAVRALRPRPVWLKGGAVLAAGGVAAAPFGAARVHTRKFSPEWFAAVHATVPFVAALRQATALPRWALVLTLAGSVGGQMAGAALERARLAAAEGRGRGVAAAKPGTGQPPRRCVGPVCWPGGAGALVVV